MKYKYTIFYVENVSHTLDFYTKAFGFKKKLITPEGDYGELLTGETTISFGSVELGNSNFKKGFMRLDSLTKPAGMEMAFVTENIDADFRKAIESGAQEYVAIQEKPWGQKVGYLLDPNGILIEICTPVAQ